MKAINFGKFHGFGNDYIVFEADDLEREVSSIEDFARTVCRRRTGIGGDGIAVLQKLAAAEADYECRIINPDGSEAGFSGNGTRCAVSYLYYKKLWDAKSLRLKTRSGIKKYELLEREQFTYRFLAELGKPKFDLPNAPVGGSAAAEFGLLIPSEEMAVRLVFVDVGNPVAVIFLEDFAQIDWRGIGSRVEVAPIFPDRTNVVFVKIVDRENIEIRIWERGAGETSSSGTCSIAAAVAAVSANKTNRKVSVHAEGGTTEAVWQADGEMLITGRADLVFCGQVFV